MVVFIPILFMYIGVFLSQFEQNAQSPSKVLSVDQYPLKQSVMFNGETIANTSNVSPAMLAQNLPNFDEAFDIQYSDAGYNATSF